MSTRQPWYIRPSVILAMMGVLLLLTVLSTKSPVGGRNGDPRLTTTSAAPMGAKLLYLLTERMGYSVQRATTSFAGLNSGTILAILDPPVALTANETHDALEHVRTGGALIAVLGSGTRLLADSLNMRADRQSGYLRDVVLRDSACQQKFSRNGLWLGVPTLRAMTVPDSLHQHLTSFVKVQNFDRSTRRDRDDSFVVLGFAYGQGRVVVASDPDVLRNDALRECWYGLDRAAVASIEYLADRDGANRRALVFDELHQEPKRRAGSRGLVGDYLTRTKSGNTILQICVAGLVLLLAAATRILPPRDEKRLERRSPLEHVDALARAYAQVGARRTGALRLVRGLERRVGGVRRGNTRVDNDQFLSRIADSVPSVKNEVEKVRNALAHSVSHREFVEVGNAIARIEAALTRN